MIGASKECTLTRTKTHVAGLAAFTTAALLSSVLLAVDPEAERFWPQWRGPYANAVSRTADPPLEWSETKNIRWKIEIPGRGSSSPVVWGDRLFVTTCAAIAICTASRPADPGVSAVPGAMRRHSSSVASPPAEVDMLGCWQA